MFRGVPALLAVLVLVAACGPGATGGADPASTDPSVTAAAATTPETPTARPSPSALATATPAASSTPTASSSAGTGSRTPEPSAPARDPSANPDPFEINLATRADFVPQYTFDWCVGASIQMARQIITGKRNETRSTQERLWELARDLTVGSPYGGANPAGWAAALNDQGLGPYRLVSLPSFASAVRRAARAISETGRPVGLVMWAGRHAWVMTGFRAAADLRLDPDAKVSRVRVMDPLYPHGSNWGPSPAPNRLITLTTLSRQFVRRDRPDYDFGVDPGWLLVLPVS